MINTSCVTRIFTLSSCSTELSAGCCREERRLSDPAWSRVGVDFLYILELRFYNGVAVNWRKEEGNGVADSEEGDPGQYCEKWRMPEIKL